MLPDSDPAAGVSLQALSVFRFSRLRNSAIVTFELTSVRPFLSRIGDVNGAVTHMTGSISAGPGGIAGGTGLLTDAAATARVSGAFNLGKFPGLLAFDCPWRLALEDSSPRWLR
jgi:hypothetical protein